MKNKINHSILIASIVCLGYILFLVYYSSSMEKINLVNFFAEILTIPIIIATVFIFSFNLYILIKNKFKSASVPILSLCIQIICFLTMFFAD